MLSVQFPMPISYHDSPIPISYHDKLGLSLYSAFFLDISVAKFNNFRGQDGINANMAKFKAFHAHSSVKAGMSESKTIRGQNSVETIVVLAGALIVLTVFLYFANEYLISAQQQKDYNDGYRAVKDLASAADWVYSQGTGAKKQVFIRIPPNVDPNETYVGKPIAYANDTSINANQINIRVYSTDIVGTSLATLKGVIPTQNGGYWVWVESFGDFVLIGQGMIATSPETIEIYMSASSASSANLTVFGLLPNYISVVSSYSWTNASAVSSSYSPMTSFTLVNASSQLIGFNFGTSASASGDYYGTFTLLANTTEMNYTLDIPVIIHAIGTSNTSNTTNCTSVMLDILTYNNSARTQATNVFNRGETVPIIGGNATANGSVTLNVFLNSAGPGASISGYPHAVSANSTGGYTDSFYSGGLATGVYNVTVTNGISPPASYLFNLTGCS